MIPAPIAIWTVSWDCCSDYTIVCSLIKPLWQTKSSLLFYLFYIIFERGRPRIIRSILALHGRPRQCESNQQEASEQRRRQPEHVLLISHYAIDDFYIFSSSRSLALHHRCCFTKNKNQVILIIKIICLLFIFIILNEAYIFSLYITVCFH